ncbi:hypothetical protein [Rheinheimera sp. UJ63]|uniref:hypothetical protein n=1 Tax=Rheinheimera sp. UJ63 TaxID=2910157 RepID=UPI001F2A61C6|nr:hypothetical protein [Rheinheimera sp. UJ63]MCF4008598.1 hypothetical protein [Rheinheimera sp. UJ63]
MLRLVAADKPVKEYFFGSAIVKWQDGSHHIVAVVERLSFASPKESMQRKCDPTSARKRSEGNKIQSGICFAEKHLCI